MKKQPPKQKAPASRKQAAVEPAPAFTAVEALFRITTVDYTLELTVEDATVLRDQLIAALP